MGGERKFIVSEANLHQYKGGSGGEGMKWKFIVSEHVHLDTGWGVGGGGGGGGDVLSVSKSTWIQAGGGCLLSVSKSTWIKQ